MQNKLFVAIACACALFSGAASADWQYTKWGMSQEEVRAVAPSEVSTIATKEQAEGLITKPSDPTKLQTAYSTGKYHFSAIFNFDQANGGLTSVTLKLLDTSKAQELLVSLRQKYGVPEKEDEGLVITTVDWDVGEDNVGFLSIGYKDKDVNIIYEPRINSNNKGL